MPKRVRPRPEFAQQVRLAEKLREFEYPDLDTKPNPPVIGGGASAIDVAASNAPSWEKEGARYLCDGVDDHLEIVTALEEAFTEGLSLSEVTLSSGSFWVDEGWVRIPEGVVLRGQGQMATLIRNQTAGTLADNPSSFNGVYLVHVNQDAELYDLGFATDSSFQGTCVISAYGLVHDINHATGRAQRFLFIRGSIGPTYNIRSWGIYNQVPDDDKRAAIETDENWVALTGVSMSVGGTGLWVGDHQGGASITGVAIDKSGPEPAVVIGNAGYVAMGDVSIRNFLAGGGPGIEVRSYPFYFQLSNINIHGTSVGLKALDDPPGWEGVSSMDISNFTVVPFETGIDLHLGSTPSTTLADVRKISIKGFRCDGSNPGKGSGWGIRLNSVFDGQSKFLISDFDIEGMDEDGIVLLGPAEGAIVHDGILKDIGKHGVVLEDISAQVHDVVANGVGQAAANTYDAVHLKGAMNTPRIHDNAILGASQLRYGINVSEAGVQRAIVVGNSGDDPSDFGTDALNDQGTDTQLLYPSDATYGDNFFRSGASSGADQAELVVAATELDRARTIGLPPPLSTAVVAVTESEVAGSIAVPAGVVFEDDWTGTNGNPWNASKWTTSVIGSATVDIQSNEGRHLLSGNQTRGRAIAQHSPITDSYLLTKLRGSTATGSLFAWASLRCDGQWKTDAFNQQWPLNGYVFGFDFDTGTLAAQIAFWKVVNGTVTNVETRSTETTADTYWIRFEVTDDGVGGVDLRAKFWLTTDPEPPDWWIEYNDATSPHASGVLQLSTLRSTSSTRSVFWDDLTLTG